MDNHDLKGWQIYDENGSVVVKIRFRTDDNNGNISKPMNRIYKYRNIIQEYHFSNVTSAKISFVINVVNMVHIEDIRNI